MREKNKRTAAVVKETILLTQREKSIDNQTLKYTDRKTDITQNIKNMCNVTQQQFSDIRRRNKRNNFESYSMFIIISVVYSEA